MTLSVKEEWRRHWGLVVASCVGFGFFTILQTSIGLFMEPVTTEFGWSRTEYTIGLSISTTIFALASPFFGILIDRWGTRPIALPGIIITGASIAAFSLANGSIMQWFMLWAIFGTVCLSVKATVWASAVSGVFDAGRGFAMAVVMSGVALTQIFLPPVGNWMIEEFGWRGAYVGLPLIWGAITFTLCFLFLRDIHDIKRAEAKQGVKQEKALVLPGLTMPQAMRNWALWRIAISTFIIMFLTQAIYVHLFPLLTESGVTRSNAAWLLSLTGVAAIAGKLITGLLMDRLNANLIGGLTLAASALTFVLLLDGVRTPALIIVAMLINGYAAGTKTQICAYVTARYVGLKNYGKVYGFMSSVMSAGSAAGPIAGAIIYETYGNYTLLLISGIVGCIISGAMIASLGPYPKFEEVSEGGEQPVLSR